jgi:hypothetical protein
LSTNHEGWRSYSSHVHFISRQTRAAVETSESLPLPEAKKPSHS